MDHRAGPARLRDLIAHRYFAVDLDLIWDAATRDVPTLLDEARQIRKRFDPGPRDTPASGMQITR